MSEERSSLGKAMDSIDQQTEAVAFLNRDRHTRQASRSRLVTLELEILDLEAEERRAQAIIDRETDRLADIQRTKQGFEILRNQLAKV